MPAWASTLPGWVSCGILCSRGARAPRIQHEDPRRRPLPARSERWAVCIIFCSAQAERDLRDALVFGGARWERALHLATHPPKPPEPDVVCRVLVTAIGAGMGCISDYGLKTDHPNPAHIPTPTLPTSKSQTLRQRGIHAGLGFGISPLGFGLWEWLELGLARLRLPFWLTAASYGEASP